MRKVAGWRAMLAAMARASGDEASSASTAGSLGKLRLCRCPPRSRRRCRHRCFPSPHALLPTERSMVAVEKGGGWGVDVVAELTPETVAATTG